MIFHDTHSEIPPADPLGSQYHKKGAKWIFPSAKLSWPCRKPTEIPIPFSLGCSRVPGQDTVKLIIFSSASRPLGAGGDARDALPGFCRGCINPRVPPGCCCPSLFICLAAIRAAQLQSALVYIKHRFTRLLGARAPRATCQDKPREARQNLGSAKIRT